MNVQQIIMGNYPINYSQKMNGKLTTKIKIKKDYIRTDGTCAVFIQCFLNSEKKIIPVNISVKPSEFDEKKQRVNSKNIFYKDYNLLIEKILSQITNIELNYRFAESELTIAKLMNELTNPTSWIDFIKFWEEEIEKQKDILKPGTYRQQNSSLSKLKEYKNPIYFHELNQDFYDEFLKYLKVKKKNNKNTINTFSKNFKKFMNIAKKRGVRISIDLDDVKISSFKGQRTFLEPKEIQNLFKYYNSEFINEAHRVTISHFLFSCFTGLRYTDVNNLTEENIIENYIVFSAEKTGKLQRITLNKTAKLFLKDVLKHKHSNEHLNRTLKDVSKICSVTKRVSFHVGRHTFATNFLISGGRVEVLQKILAHSKIEETMIYVHIVESISNEQIMNMDEILIID